MKKYLTILNFNINKVNIYEIDDNQYDFYMEDKEAFIKDVVGLNYNDVSTMISDEEPFITKEKLITKIKNYSHSQAFKLYRQKVKELNSLLRSNELIKESIKEYIDIFNKYTGYDALMILDTITGLKRLLHNNLVDIKVLNSQCKILKHKVIEADKKFIKK